MGLEDQPAAILNRLGAAREKLEGQDLAGALEIYEDLLAEQSDNADVLTAVSADLGSTGHLAPVIGLIAPLYDPERHGPAAGLNLLQAYLLAGDADGAQHLLDLLSALGRPELEERLFGFANAISQLGATEAPSDSPARAPAPPKGMAVSISKPIWFYGLEAMTAQILPAKGEGLRRVAFTQLALPGTYDSPGEAMKKPEDERGRLSRALPLWLAETFYFSPNYASSAAMAMAERSDGRRLPVILDAEWTVENLRQLVATTAGGLDYVFTGMLRGRGEVYDLTLRLWEVKKFRERKQFVARWTPATADAELAGLRDAICRFMECAAPSSGTALSFSPSASPGAWLEGLGASLGLFLAEKKILPPELLGPLAPAWDRLKPLAAREPAAALAWLTLRARAQALGIDCGASEAALVDHPVVAQARKLLGL